MKALKIIFLLALPIAILSCNSQAGNKNRDNNNRQNVNKSNSKRDVDTVSKSSMLPRINLFDQQDDDMDFLKEAASGGLLEVELGRYAEQNAQNPRVKKFGAMMVKDHQKVNDELKSLASEKNVTLPAQLEGKHRDMLEDLQKENGADFDKAYMKGMVSDHEKDVDQFKKVAEGAKDPQIKTFAAKTLPVLLMHLDSAKSIHDAIK
jgi:putative membrane protein